MKNFPFTSMAGIAVLCLLTVGVAPLRAETPDEALRELETAVRQDLAQKTDAEGPHGERGSMGPMMLSQLRSSLGREESSGRDNALDQLTTYFQSDTVRAAVEKLRTAIRAERAAREKASVEEVKTLLSSAATAVQEARSPADLDKTLTELSTANLRRQSVSDRGAVEQTGSTRIQNALRFVTSWQTYIANKSAGEWSQAIQNLQTLTSADSVDLLPRSQLLGRLDEAKRSETEFPLGRCREIMAKTRTFDDLSVAIDALAAVQALDRQHSGSNDFVPSLRNQLIALRTTYRDYQAGIGTGLSIRPGRDQNLNEEVFQLVRPLQLQMIRLGFPRYLETKELPTADEPMEIYLDRINAQAITSLDARMMERVSILRGQLNGTATGYQAPSPILLLISGRNQEDAGQYEPAVITYQRALKTGGSLIPAEAVGARLEGIRKAHPQEYESALQRFLAASDPASVPTFPDGGRNPNSINLPGLVPTPRPTKP